MSPPTPSLRAERSEGDLRRCGYVKARPTKKEAWPLRAALPGAFPSRPFLPLDCFVPHGFGGKELKNGVRFWRCFWSIQKGIVFLDECVQCVRIIRKRVFPQEIIIDSWRHSQEMILKCQTAHIAFFKLFGFEGNEYEEKLSAAKQKQLCSLGLRVTKYLCLFFLWKKKTRLPQHNSNDPPTGASIMKCLRRGARWGSGLPSPSRRPPSNSLSGRASPTGRKNKLLFSGLAGSWRLSRNEMKRHISFHISFHISYIFHFTFPIFFAI